MLATAALACLYLAVFNGHMQTADGLMIYRQGVSLAYNHSMQISPPVWWGVWRSNTIYGIALSLLYVPGLLIFSWLHPLVPVQPGPTYDWALLYADPLYAVTGAVIHLGAIVLAAFLVARLLQQLGYDTRIALWGLALYGVGSPAIVVARGDTAQSVASLAWIAAVYAAVRVRQTGRTRWLWVCGGSVALAILARQADGVFILPAVLLLLAPSFRFWRWPGAAWNAAGIVGGLGVAAIVANLGVNWIRFGSPFNTGYISSWTTPLPVGLTGALISPGRGILWAFPAVILTPLGFRALWMRGERRLAIALTGCALALLLTLAVWTWWWGGWNWGLRLFFPALPLLAVLAAVGITLLPRPAHAWVPAVLLLGGVVWAAPTVITDLLGGYAATYDGTSGSFRLSAYPPIGAWRFFQHWRALSLEDSHAADILWLRLARRTHNLSLLPPLAFGLSALALLSRTSPRRR